MASPSWEYLKAETFSVGSVDPVTTKAAVAAPTGGATVDAEARTAINAIITVLEQFGLVEPN